VSRTVQGVCVCVCAWQTGRRTHAPSRAPVVVVQARVWACHVAAGQQQPGRAGVAVRAWVLHGTKEPTARACACVRVWARFGAVRPGCTPTSTRHELC
jgi:hypothetical protein